MKKGMIFTVSLCLCLVIIWTVKVHINKHQDASGFSSSEYTIPRQIQYLFTVQNTSKHLLKKAEFWTYAPVQQTAVQYCSKIESAHAYEVIIDDLGNQVLHFTFDEFPPYATRIITVKAKLFLSKKANPVAVSNRRLFLKPEKFIESDDPQLCRLARELKTSTPLKTAERIFRWVVDNVQYAGYLINDRGALYALRNRKGDCTEFMYLFAALCRANNIPARCIGGYICKKNRILKPANYHNWAEFYLDGAWRISDPQNKIFMKDPSDYIAMRLIKGSINPPAQQFNRYRVKGEGLKVKMNS
jgi:transglutaminase-like putative cysteine protease